MLFEIHSEKKISFKRLTDADLKRSPKSNQTHIGLSINSLTFMANEKTEYYAMLIFKEYCDILSCEVGKILRADGRKDAPKISMGNTSDNIVNKIRSFASEAKDKLFYLLWYGLDSETPVFWLIEENSYDYDILNRFCNFSSLNTKHIVTMNEENNGFAYVLEFARKRLENVTTNLQKDLETSVEIENDNPKFKVSDVKKAKSYIREIGRRGEELVNEYLKTKTLENIVDSYDWINESSEQGKPYDFYVSYSNGHKQWIDVKSTEHEFEQSIIVSKNEIRFISGLQAPDYSVFRVYSIKELKAKLKICTDCLKYITKLSRDIDYITASMSDYRAAIVNYKIAFEPGTISFRSVSDEIKLRMAAL